MWHSARRVYMVTVSTAPTRGARFVLATLLALALLLLTAACLTNDSAGAPPTPTPTARAGDGGFRLIVAATDLSVGANRLPFVVFDPLSEEVAGADATVDLFWIDPETRSSTLRSSGINAPYRALDVPEEHVHSDGSLHLHEESFGIYVAADAVFDEAGTWGVRVRLTGIQGAPVEAAGTVVVREGSITPPVGAIAPRSETPTATDAAGLARISTRQPPLPAMYRSSVADAIGAERPVLLSFSTPAFCQSRVCGPVLGVIANLMPDYQDRIEFIHVEPYDIAALRNNEGLVLTPWATEWNLPSEPWTFLITARGTIHAKFEGVVTPPELKSALDSLLGA